MILSSTTLRLLVVAIFWSILHTITFALPPGFVYLEDIDASIIQDIKFGTADNIVGHPLPGYKKPRCILTKEAAVALRHAQTALRKLGLSLIVLQAYQPKQSGDYLKAWSQKDAEQIIDGITQGVTKLVKAVNKKNAEQAIDRVVTQLPEAIRAKQFSHKIWEPSRYSRGSTVALKITTVSPSGKRYLKKHHDLLSRCGCDIVACLDFRNQSPRDVSSKHRAQENVNYISMMLYNYFIVMHMDRCNFELVSANTKWMMSVTLPMWVMHFTLKNEPFPNTEFDFPVE